MSRKTKQLSNPFSTGGGGAHFEAHIQASFVTLMLTGGYAPCLPCWPITEIKLQGKIDGFDTDDLIVFVVKPDTQERRKLLGQIKHSISITKGSGVLAEVIQAAWNDFNNPKVFNKGKDIIALITGPLSATDANNVQWLLNQARHTKSVEEFIRNVEQANFSPAKSGEKLAVIQHHLKTANNDTDVSRDELYDFLNHFHLLVYDLGREVGVVLSLLHSHISQFNQKNPQWVWSTIVDIVQTWNQDAGTITPIKLPDSLIEAFKQPTIVQIPKELATAQPGPTKTDWNNHQHAADLALANLFGAWDEKNKADLALLGQFFGADYDTWIPKVREILHLPDSPLSLKNGQWKLTERVNLWDLLASRIFDQNLDAFKVAVVDVLTERDPAFELPAEERYAASIHGKVLTHSLALRKGLAEGLAMVGSMPEALTTCSLGKAEKIAILAIHEIFTNADWVLWGSLNSLLPILAEAAPYEFLDAVESALQLSPCPFGELFAQESSGITGSNYLTGLFWALEGLAWDEEYLVRVCVVLSELANHDPGGRWANRPDSSLATILLPWLPQTAAPFEKRKVAVQTLCKEWPEAGWKLVINMLPNQFQTSMGSHKPSWRKSIPDSWEKPVTHQEYREQVTYYAELAVSMANHDTVKLAELIEHFDNLPKPSFDKLIEVLLSDEISELHEDDRLQLWDRLVKFISKHRRFSDAKWALTEDLLSSIESAANRLAPSDPLNLYQHLFSNRDFDLYEVTGNWEEQEKKLQDRRQKAVEEIMESGGVELVVQFAQTVEAPGQVGFVLGCISDSTIDAILLPEYMESGNTNLLSLASAYVRGQHQTKGWSWADKLDKAAWTNGHVGQFLSFLPFTNETWDRAVKWLGDAQGEYWSKANANPYQAEGELDVAVDKLIEYGRPYAAITCLDKMLHAKQPVDVAQCVQTLHSALLSKEPPYAMDGHHVLELIKYLQSNPEVSADDLFRIEWAYLPLLERHRGAGPKLLENRLANDPEFFCEVIRYIYRSKKTEDTSNKEPSEDSKTIATNAWRLLHEWQLPPGAQNDGSFDAAHFQKWLQRVKALCEESGHLEVALINIGEVLIHAPSDPDGLWIHRAVATALNARDAEDMRDGFRTGTYNSRGAHWVDPTGKPELEFAKQFRQKAEDVENAGFQRLAVTLRGLADSYDMDAERIIADHKQEDTE